MKYRLITALCAFYSISNISTVNAGETEAFLGGMISGFVLNEVIDNDYYPPVYRPYANNYGNFNQYEIYDSNQIYYEYDDPTTYRPVCQRFYKKVYDPYNDVLVRKEFVHCSTEKIR